MWILYAAAPISKFNSIHHHNKYSFWYTDIEYSIWMRVKMDLSGKWHIEKMTIEIRSQTVKEWERGSERATEIGVDIGAVYIAIFSINF